MKKDNTNNVVYITDYKVVSTRIIGMDIKKVYQAFANPDYLKNWWGPNGFTNTFYVFNLIEGGKWSFVMHGPDGKNYPNESEFVKVIAEKVIVFNHISLPQFQMTISFKEYKKKNTEFSFQMVFTNEKDFEALKDFVANKNEENFDRLETELKKINDAEK